MVLPTMTYTEIVNEILKDHQPLYAFAEHIMNNKKLQRLGMKHAEPIHFEPVEWTSNRKNHYVILPHTNGKKFVRKYGISCTIFCYYYDEKNYLNAVVFSKPGYHTFFRSHLFDRYAERFLGDTSLGKLELMKKFIKYNNQLIGKPFDSAVKHKDSFYARVSDGVILGNKTKEGYVVYNTFITEEMLKGEELDYNTTCKIELENALRERAKLPITTIEWMEQQKVPRLIVGRVA